jgi:UDP-N-acetylmuramyl pentapeptide phosphotransferase/UDP-N-acetylglucosamine-1-phosphate transferase
LTTQNRGLAMLIDVAIVISAGAFALLATGALITLLRRADVLDHPNERSSHAMPTPRGGGIAVIGATLVAWCALLMAKDTTDMRLAAVIGGAAVLAVVSWRDDRVGLPPWQRLLVQFLAVGVGIIVATPTGAVFQGWLPPALDLIATACAWLWFVNLFNFMDGIDGLAGSETVAIAFGLVLFALFGVGYDARLAALASVIAVAALGFLVWNWAPARIFLGDVGSIPLGYLLGFLLLNAAGSGHWKIALILPLYFLADATITLLRRLLRGERVWQAHREHFYQRAVQRGRGHGAVVKRVIAANLLLIALGWAAENGLGVAGSAIAFVVVAALLADLAGLQPSGASPVHPAKPAIEESPPG